MRHLGKAVELVDATIDEYPLCTAAEFAASEAAEALRRRHKDWAFGTARSRPLQRGREAALSRRHWAVFLVLLSVAGSGLAAERAEADRLRAWIERGEAGMGKMMTKALNIECRRRSGLPMAGQAHMCGS